MPPTSSHARQPWRALIVAADPAIRDAVRTVFGSAGHIVVFAGDDHDGAQLSAGLRFDVAAVELGRPGSDPGRLVSSLRTNPVNRRLPVMALVAGGDTDAVGQAFAAGATTFLVTPLDRHLLLQQVGFVLAAGRDEAELSETIRAAEFMDDLKTRLVLAMLGELQASLRSAQGMAELLRREVYGPLGNRIYREYAEDLHRALEQLNATQLTAFTTGRLGAGDVRLREEDVALTPWLAAMAEDVRARAARHGIEVEVRLGIGEQAVLRCDRALIAHAVRLLVQGAIQCAPAVSIITLAARIDTAGDMFISIEDDAPALPRAAVRDILGAGMPVAGGGCSDAIVSRTTGLSVSRVLAEAHQGRFALNSTSGEGTIARLILPSQRILRALQTTDDASRSAMPR